MGLGYRTDVTLTADGGLILAHGLVVSAQTILDTSRPILQRLGFIEIAETTPYRYAAGEKALVSHVL